MPRQPESADGTDGGTDKLNTALAYGGLACTVKTVSELTGLEIPYAAVIEFNGVVAMSNAVGGVTVCVAEKIEDEYTGTFLDPGEHELEGMAALQFLRTRHGIADRKRHGPHLQPAGVPRGARPHDQERRHPHQSRSSSTAWRRPPPRT